MGSYFVDILIFWLLLKPGPRPWIWTLKKLDQEKRGKGLDAEKRLNDYIYNSLTLKICLEETCSKPSGRVVIEDFEKWENVLKNQNEIKINK